MNDAPSGTDLRFPSTCWSRIENDASAALETLAQRYWRPIHAYLRCALHRTDADARDLTQDFFVWMIETSFVHKADPARGRFRAFLKTALRRYVGDQDERARARKRGGGRRFVPLASDDPATTALELPAGDRTPEQALDDAWRAEVIAQALARLESELAARGQERVFAVFRDYFLDPADDVDYAAVAARRGVTTTDVSNFLQRAKAMYRAHLRALIADTVHGGRDLDDELAWFVRKAPR